MRGRGGNGWIVLMTMMTLSDDDERGGEYCSLFSIPTVYPFNAGVGEMRGVYFGSLTVHLDSSISRQNRERRCIVIVAPDPFSSSPLKYTLASIQILSSRA